MIPEHVRLEEEYYLLASASAQRRPQALLNHAESFAIFDLAGDIPLAYRDSYGLFHRGTRFLHRYELRLNGKLPLLLSTATTHEGSGLVTHLSNADELRDGEVSLLRDTVAVRRDKTLLGGSLYERVQLQNYGQEPLRLELEVLFGADFADIFELRGSPRARRGEATAPKLERDGVRLPYRGVDGVWRETVLTFTPAPSRLGMTGAGFVLSVGPGEEAIIEVRVTCEASDAPPAPAHTFASALTALLCERGDWRAQFPLISSDHEGLNAWLERSLQDLTLLRSETEYGSYAYAGIPWFATIFGRDGLITALETLGFSAGLAAGTLRTLAGFQGKEFDGERDEEPGKIVHEMRRGEMAATGEIPFGRYYGTIDATPLFVWLLAAYAERTGDLALVRELWPAALAAVRWMDTAADAAGYLAYARQAARGLINQGWKDSHDAVMHADGTLAEPPVALAEVQAYAYAARRGLARLAHRLAYPAEAAAWEAQADRLRRQFQRDFWLPAEGTFALALDGRSQPCRVVSSNAGHCLFAGIASPAQARQVVSRLMRDDMFCGWGVRTLSARACRYNPMSYHNGSVWPHDNAMIAAGFARYGASAQAGQLFSALFDASQSLDDHRLPELFCGFPRELQHGPVPYPVACKPQAWAAGSVFLLLQAALGLRVDAWERRVTFERVTLPPWLNEVSLRGLRVGDARVDLSVVRGRWGAAVEVVDRQGDVEVVVHK
ncbi:MAG TPA: amylo-alpha-1,6-glucosidase [Candidatus Binatia bacterium]|nr:amylo-alpha-1,6-glucosidase [Candidatus Binatia bacterium]